jgi:hypothetical protein
MDEIGREKKVEHSSTEENLHVQYTSPIDTIFFMK